MFFCEIFLVVVVTSSSTVLKNAQIPGLLPYRSICIPELKTSLSFLFAAIQFIILKATDDI